MTDDRKPAPAADDVTTKEMARTKAALRAGGIEATVNDDGSIDIPSFVAGAHKHWAKVIDKLAEYDRECSPKG